MADALRTSALLTPLRAYGSAILKGYDDPHAEVLALVWGPQFDRELAHTLLERKPDLMPQMLPTFKQSADHFDQLATTEQRRGRQLILRHRRRCDNVQVPH